MLKWLWDLMGTIKDLFFYINIWILFLSLRSSHKTLPGVKYIWDSQHFHVNAAINF